MSINVVFNSSNYQVLEYPELNAFELVNHARSTGALIHGDMARVLRAQLQHLFAADPTEEAVEEMIGGYEALMHLPVRYL